MPSAACHRAIATLLLAWASLPVAATGLNLSLPPAATRAKSAPLFSSAPNHNGLSAVIHWKAVKNPPQRQSWKDVLLEPCQGPPATCAFGAAASAYSMLHEEHDFAQRARCIGALAPDYCYRLR